VNLSKKFQKRGKFSSAAARFHNASLQPGTGLCPKNARAATNRFFLKKRQKRGFFCNALILFVVIQSQWNNHIQCDAYPFLFTLT
jgi:hypothetical protein